MESPAQQIDEEVAFPDSYVFLTGATGLVGRYLVRDLLLKGVRLAVLVRPTKKLTAHERMESVLQYWERKLNRSLPRPIVLTGDVNQSQLGLGEFDLKWLKENCEYVIHNAAVLSFYGSDSTQEPWRTNVGGTQNVIEVAKQIEATNWHYVSTGYVCGCRKGVIYEGELDGSAGFRNDYEESKFQAEKMIRAEADGVAELTVYRPAVIVGDSTTGYTSSYHGLFLYLRLMATLVPEQPRDENGVIQTPIRLQISGDEPRNLVPVDWVSSSIARLFGCPEAHGKTFHLAPKKRVTSREIIDSCNEYFNSQGVVYTGVNADPQSPKEEFEANRFEELILESSRMYDDYFTQDPNFDLTNLEHYISDYPCPKIDREMIFKFIEFGTRDRWGKRRGVAPEIACWFGEKLLNVSQLDFLSPVKKAFVGIDIHGPGGGQWQITIDGKSRTVQRGLPNHPIPVITLDSNELQEKLSQADEAEEDIWQAVFAF